MLNIESILQEQKIHYTKEVDGKAAVSFSLPYNVAGNMVAVFLFPRSDVVQATIGIRTLDSIGTSSTKTLLRELLRLNGFTRYSKVILWSTPGEEVDWIAVDACIPSDALTASSLMACISDALALTEQVMQTIAACSGALQKQASPT